jgi:hypothetical protein
MHLIMHDEHVLLVTSLAALQVFNAAINELLMHSDWELWGNRVLPRYLYAQEDVQPAVTQHKQWHAELIAKRAKAAEQAAAKEAADAAAAAEAAEAAAAEAETAAAGAAEVPGTVAGAAGCQQESKDS